MAFPGTVPGRFSVALAAVWLMCGTAPPAAAQAAGRAEVADVLAETDLADPAGRAAAVAEIRELQEARRRVAVDVARQRGLPVRVEGPDGTVREIAMIDDLDRPVYFLTHNDRAAISTAADVLNGPDFGLEGGGVLIGMWDGGSGRASHQEFAGGRMVVRDGASPITHATHVGGTLAAAGAAARARGMAPAAVVESYDWNSDKAEMAARAATGPGQADALYLSNHSYGFIGGWLRTGGDPAFVWYGSGSGATALDPRFGQYSTTARDSDALAFDAPYYLMFRSAGNDGTDNPAAGQPVRLSPGATTTESYDASVHPAGDGVYRGGFDTIGFDAVAKNVVTVGSVADAVSSGQRDPTRAGISSFSSWGPTDDGRIKPDIVANGESLYSPVNGGDSAYGNLSGTSMSSPNAAGTAALLIEEYGRLFPGEAMRAATLKGLLIHTADDLGNPGPDYRNGWGLLNGEAAAGLIRDHAENPLKVRLNEGVLEAAELSVGREFVWDGESPIRVTLSWTDPPGGTTTAADNRSARLRNNLDLRIVGPEGGTYSPYVMPFVGAWTRESMDLPATSGVNNTDNVEQVFIESPPAPGTYRAVVGFQGTLADNRQSYSLLVSGSAAEEPPPPSLALTGVTPPGGSAGNTVTLEIAGSALSSVTDVRLTRDGFADLAATNLRMAGESLRADVDLTGAAEGEWDLAAGNAEETAVLADAFAVTVAIFSESFDGTVTGWTSEAVTGSNAWTLSTAEADSPPTSYFAPGPATPTTARLVSPPVVIPDNATDLQLRFRHRFELESRRDGARLEISTDDGASWFGAGSGGSGTEFASNGYNSEIRDIGNPNDRSDFDRLPAWSGDSGGFLGTLVNFTDSARFAGETVRFRWVIATGSSTASHGWYVDSIALTGEGDLANRPPSITSPPATATDDTLTENEVVYHLVEAGSVEASVSAEDDGGENGLTYTWSASGPAPVFFLPNGDNGASVTTATFEASGDYELVVTVTDGDGLSTSGGVTVRVVPVASALAVDPVSASLAVGESQGFSATLLDQFNVPLADQPTSFDWSATGGGVIDSAGLFVADSVGENFSVVASAPAPSAMALHGGARLAAAEIRDFAQVTVTPAAASVTLGDLEQVFDGEPKPVSVATDPSGLAVAVTYDGATTPPSETGSYQIEATVDDPNYQGGATGLLEIVADPEEPSAFDLWRDGIFGEGSADDPDALPEADPDGDGISNWVEFHLGTDPLDPDSRLRMEIGRDADGGLELLLGPAVTTGTYFLETAESPAGPWDGETEITVETDADALSVPAPPQERRAFHRLRYQAPPIE